MVLIERKILLAGLIVYVVLGLFAVFVLYQPRLASRQRHAAEVTKLSKELRETQERVKGIGGLRVRLAELQATNAAFAARVAPRSGILAVVEHLAAVAEDKKVRFIEVAPPGLDTLLQEESSNAPLRAVPFMVTTQGRFLDIGRYVESLNDFPYFVRVPDFEVTAREDIRPEVEVKMLVNLYASSLTTEGKL